MKKIFALSLIVLLSLSGCEKDDICDANTPTTPRLVIDFYNTHLQASSNDAAKAARRSNVRELCTYINEHSAGKPVILMGDFNSRYLIQAESSTVGAEAPQMNGTRKMTIEAAWQGACPSDFKPGDMEIAGGVRINLLDMGC